jgi:hypothetical protein
MKHLAALLLALAALGPYQAATGNQWECLDSSGQKVVQDHPCTQADPEFRAETVPGYIWGLIALLGVVWLKALLPQRLFRRGAATGPGMPELLAADGPSFADTPAPPRPVARPAPAPAAATPKPAAPGPAAPVPTAPGSWSIETLRGLESMKLALLVQGFWRARSCTVDFGGQTPAGAELMIHRPSTGRLFAIAQCASMRTGTVGSERLQQLWGHVEQHQAALGLYYGAAFSPEAQAFVKGRRLKLITAADLLVEVQALPADQQKALLESMTRGF